jgi:hypothetical protein
MNPFDAENSVPNYLLSFLILDPDAMCRQVRGEREALYVPEQAWMSGWISLSGDFACRAITR